MVTVCAMGYASPCDELQSHLPTYFKDVSMEELNATASLVSNSTLQAAENRAQGWSHFS